MIDLIRKAMKKDLDVLLELSIQFHAYFDEIYGDELNPKITSKTDIKETLKLKRCYKANELKLEQY